MVQYRLLWLQKYMLNASFTEGMPFDASCVTMVKIAQIFIFLSLFLCVWGTSGTLIWSLMPMFFSASVALIFLLWSKKDYGTTHASIWTSPFFFPGLILLIINLIQSINPDTRVVQFYAEQYAMGVPHVDGIPSGISRDIEFQDTVFSLLRLLSVWYFASATWLCLRCGKFMRRMLAFFVVNVAIMSVFAIIQRYLAAPFLYWIIPTKATFYGSFFLENAATDMMNMAAFGALSLMYISYREKNISNFIIYLLSLLLCGFAVMYSTSEGSKIVLAGGMLILIFLFLVHLRLKKLLFFLLASLVCFLVVIFSAFDMHKYVNGISNSLNSRSSLVNVSGSIFKDHYLYGAGGGSYGVRASQLGLDNDLELRPGMEDPFINAAHNDVFEYFCEFGIFAIISFALAVFLWLRLLFINKRNLSFANVVISLGIVASFVHSLFDLNLHVAATMFAFCMFVSLSVFNFGNES